MVEQNDQQAVVVEMMEMEEEEEEGRRTTEAAGVERTSRTANEAPRSILRSTTALLMALANSKGKSIAL